MSHGSQPSPDQPRDDPARQAGFDARLRLYAYLDAREHRRTYLAIMRLFAGTLLADLSAGEVASALVPVERDGQVSCGESRVENVIPRLRQLAEWGNLVAGRREVVATSIAEFRHGSVRYQVSKLGVRVQRDVDELLRTAEGAREVSSELLPAIGGGLDELVARFGRAREANAADRGAPAARRSREQLSEAVTTLFLQHAELAATVRDFYAYLGNVVATSQLAPDAIEGFRNLLVEYIQKVVDDVLLHTPAIARTLTSPELRERRGHLLQLLRPSGGLGEDVERARGRDAADWDELTDWFVDRPGRPSQVTALRDATGRAIGALLANVKRATSGAVAAPGRRAELEKLARWFDAADQEQASRIYCAAFGSFAARHVGQEPAGDGDGAATSWSDAPAIELPVSVRSRGDRSARGRATRIVEDPIGAEALLAEAREARAGRGSAVAELAAAGGELAAARLSDDALHTVCGMLTTAMAQREHPEDSGQADDRVHGLRLRIEHAEGTATRIAAAGGTLTMHDAVVSVRSRTGGEI